MKLQFDVNNIVEDFTIVLSTRWYEHYGQIRNVKRDSVTCKRNMNAANELSFEVYKTLDGVDERLWDDIIDLKLVWVKELNEYYEINVSLDDSINPCKTVTCTSLCEAELSQVNLYNIEINSDADIERPEYKATKFYDPDNPKASLLHRILDKVPHYSIKRGCVDKSLWNLQRTFSIDGTSVYDWLVGECSEQFNCLFEFDTTDRTISVYDLYTVCKGNKEDGEPCEHRGEFDHVCPECGSTKLKYFGEDTTIFIDKENLTDSVKFETDIGSVKNCFKLVAGDDDMTATVRLLNPNGTDYIYYISDEQKADMPKELVEKIESYDELVASYTKEYEQLVEEIQEIRIEKAYYEHEMMPSVEAVKSLDDIGDPKQGIVYLCNGNVYVYDGKEFVKQDETAEFYLNLVPSADVITASKEAAKLTKENLSQLVLEKITSSTSKSTIENALKNYAKVYVKTGYVKLEINQSNYTYEKENVGKWTGNFKVTGWSDEEDIAYSEVITIDILGGSEVNEEFVRQKVMKAIASDSEDDKEGSVFDVLSIDELEDFKAALKLYCKVRLESFESAIEGARDVLMTLDQANEEADLYEVFYKPYTDKIEACNDEINLRDAKIAELENQYDALCSRANEIQKILNFEAYLGEELYSIFCSYRREDTYSNDNYISDGLDNAGTFDKAKDFIQKAKEELYKAAMRQHSISSTLHNLLVMPEFEVIIDKFELGNWIRIRVDETIYRLRLISYEINFSDIQTLNVEFSDVTRQIGCVSDIQSILDSAQQMATSYSSVSKQAEKGEFAQRTFDQMKEEGLDSALIQINNNTNEEITYGKHGLLARSYDDMIDDYDPEQLKITHNILCFTDNNWKSVKCALGKHDYYKYDNNGNLIKDTAYGLTSDFVTAGYINGSQIIGGEIYSTNYSPTKKTGSHINLLDGTFSFAGGKIKYDGNIVKLNGVSLQWEDVENANSIATQITKDTVNTSYVNALNITAKEVSSDWVYAGNIKAGQIKTGVITSTDGKTTKINLDNGTFSIGNGALKWDGTTLTISSPSIPTKVSQLNNDSGYQNATGVVTIAKGAITADYIKTLNLEVGNQIKMGANATISWNNVTSQPTIPTKTSQLTNDSGYQNSTQVTTITKNTVTTSYVNALSVKAGSVDAENITGTKISGKTISGGSLLIGNKSGTYAEITSAGVLNCYGANITGKITATTGKIGNWNVYSNGMLAAAQKRSDNYWYGIALDPHEDAFVNNERILAIGRIGVGGEANAEAAVSGNTWGSPNFSVRSDGSVVANKLTTSGITATGGTIGGWSISSNGLSSGSSYIMNDGRFCFMPDNADNWCGFLKLDSDTYNFCIGSASQFQLGSTILTEAKLKKLLALIS